MKKLLLYTMLTFLITLICTGINLPSYILITSLYNETHQERVEEYLTCLRHNLDNKLIKKIIVFYDTTKDVQDHQQNVLLKSLQQLPVTLYYVSDRPSFEDCFKLANAHYPQERIMIANADIFFNETLLRLDRYSLSGMFIALTRWNLQSDGTLKFYGSNFSQDVWIFTPPLPTFGKSSYKLGTPACDIYIAYQAKQAGLHVVNPALSIQAIHLHNTGVRNYTPVDPAEPFIGLLPISLPE